MLLLRTLAAPNMGVGIGKNHQRTVGVMTPLCFVLLSSFLATRYWFVATRFNRNPQCSPSLARNTGLRIPKSAQNCLSFHISGSACCSLGTSSANCGSHDTVMFCTSFIPSTRDKIVATRLNRNCMCSVSAVWL